MASSETAKVVRSGADVSAPKNIFTIGTRRSQLARVQTDIVAAALQKEYPQHEYRIHAMDPLGDRDKVTALYRFNNENAKGLWTHELEEMLSGGELDLIVHSLKDMPTTLPPGLALGAVFKREDPRDALVLKASATLPHRPFTAHDIISGMPAGAIIGTSSLRRAAQLRRKYPYLEFRDVRGNVPTRVKKLDEPKSFDDQQVPEYTALVLAAAGLIRLGMADRITAYLSGRDGGVLHAVGQGAIGVEIREGDEKVQTMLKNLGDWRSERACLVERSILRTLEGGCSVPIGVETEWADEEGHELIIRAAVVSVDGKDAGEVEETALIRTAEDANEFGQIIANLLIEKGANKILDDVKAHRLAGDDQTVA